MFGFFACKQDFEHKDDKSESLPVATGGPGLWLLLQLTEQRRSSGHLRRDKGTSRRPKHIYIYIHGLTKASVSVTCSGTRKDTMAVIMLMQFFNFLSLSSSFWISDKSCNLSLIFFQKL